LVVVAASVLAGGVPLAADLLAAELSVTSAVLLFFDRDFLVLAVSAPVVPFPGESAVAVLLDAELSVVSAVLLFLEVLFLGVAVALSGAAASVLVAAFFLDLEVLVFVESVVASGLLWDVSEDAAFFLVFFLVVELASVWSLESDDPDCCAARAVRLPKISSIAATSANTTPLLAFIDSLPPLASALQHTTLF